MNDDAQDIYLDEIHEAVLKAGGGEEGLIDVHAAALACIGTAASLISILPRNDCKAFVKHIIATFGPLVASARRDVEQSKKEGVLFENVKLN